MVKYSLLNADTVYLDPSSNSKYSRKNREFIANYALLVVYTYISVIIQYKLNFWLYCLKKY